MASEDFRDGMVLEHIHAIGLECIGEWDTLEFLYRHSASLGSAVQIARITGYDKSKTAATLHKLEGLGLVQRSRASQGIRMYRYSTPPEPGRRSSLLELMSLAQNRTGRLVLLKHLQITRQGSRRRPDSSGLSLA